MNGLPSPRGANSEESLRFATSPNFAFVGSSATINSSKLVFDSRPLK